MVKIYYNFSVPSFLFVIIMLDYIHNVQGDANCITPMNTNGFCINIMSCQSLLDILKSPNPDAITYLQNATCGFEGIYPLVCCQENEQDSTSIPQSSSESSTNFQEIPKYKLPRSPHCGLSNATNNKVVNGDPAKLGEFPWIVALGYRNIKDPNIPRWLCAGTLITNIHVMTAGHCVYNRSDLYLARLGELDLYSDYDGAQPIDVYIEKMKLHEEYNSYSITNDVALLTLVNPVSGIYISPICLPIDDPLRTQNFVRYYPFVAGWGAIYFDGPSSSHLQVVMLPVVSNEQCQQAYTNFKNTIIDDRSICAGYMTGGKDACQGDSGGPLMLANGQNPFTYYQIGIVSYGFRCAEQGVPGVYTRVTYFLDWIEKNLD